MVREVRPSTGQPDPSDPVGIPGPDAGTVDAWVALGSNVGDRLAHLRTAVQALETLGRVVAVSSVYESAPVGPADQPDYLNGVVHLRTSLEPRRLLAGLLAIERARGRVRGRPSGPRTLDLDLLFHGSTVCHEAGLTLPHPRWAERSFVLAPLAEIAAAWTDPVSGRAVSAVWTGARDTLPIVRRIGPLAEPAVP